MSQPESSDKRLNQIVRWAEQQTGEEKDWSADPSYLVPRPIERLVNRIENSSSSLDFVLAFQGTGKSVAASYLKWRSGNEGEKLQRVLRVKLKEPGNIIHQIFESMLEWDVEVDIQSAMQMALLISLHDYTKSNHSFWERLNDLRSDRDISERAYWTIDSVQSGTVFDEERWGTPEFGPILRILPERKLRPVEEEVVLSTICSEDGHWVNALVFDSPDYRRNDVRLASRDMDELSRLWQLLLTSKGWTGHFVVFMQRELNIQHFFVGKGDKILLERFKPEELVHHYHECFSDSFPFTAEALLQLAAFSNGNFRRFKKYISRSIDAWGALESRNLAPTIEISLVKEAVTDRELAADLEAELSRLFSGEGANNACRLVSFVMRKNGTVNQKAIAKELGLGEDVVGRVIRTLEEEKYLKRTRTAEGYIVSLA